MRAAWPPSEYTHADRLQRRRWARSSCGFVSSNAPTGKGRRGDKAAALAKTPPNFGDASAFERLRSTCRLGRLLLRHLRLQDRDCGADLDRAGLRRLRHIANHVDMEP